MKNFTPSKVLGYFIAIAGLGLTIYLRDKSIWSESIMYSTILLGVKTVTAGMVEAKKGEQNNA